MLTPQGSSEGTRATQLVAVTLPVFTKFRLQITLDVANFVLPAICLLPHRIGLGLAVFIALLSRGIRDRIAQMHEDSPTRRQRWAHANLVIVGYLIWIAGTIYAAVHFNDPAVWALSSVLIPVLAVFCYLAVRVNLGLDRPWGTVPAKASNQTME